MLYFDFSAGIYLLPYVMDLLDILICLLVRCYLMSMFENIEVDVLTVLHFSGDGITKLP